MKRNGAGVWNNVSQIASKKLIELSWFYEVCPVKSLSIMVALLASIVRASEVVRIVLAGYTER